MRTLKVLKKAKFLGEEQLGANLITRALEEPTRQIANNAGFEGAVVVQRVMEGKGSLDSMPKQGLMKIL